MAYNEIRTINNIQLEDIKARQSIQELDNKKANKSDIVNGLNFKGTTTYSALPTSDNSVGDFYYVTDGDGTNGEGNYAWNGTAWYFSGKTTDFGDISTKANTAVNDAAFEEGKLKVTKNDGTSTETEVIDSSLTKSGKAADAKITGDEIGQLKEDIATAENGISLVYKNVLGNLLRNGTQIIVVGQPFNEFMPDARRVITNDILLKGGGKFHIKASGFEKYKWFYSFDGETISYVSDWVEENSIDKEWKYTTDSDVHTKFIFAKADNSALPVYEIDFKITGDKIFSDGLYERVNILEKEKENKKTCLNISQSI